MNELDDKVLNLFRYLINSGTKYLASIDYNKHKLRYKVNGRDISISLYKYSDRKDVSNSYSTLDSVFSSKCGLWPFWFEIAKTDFSEIGYEIDLEGRSYEVPKLARVEQAQVLDKLDNILESKEKEILDTVMHELTVSAEL